MQFPASAKQLHGRATLPAWGLGSSRHPFFLKRKKKKALEKQDKGGKIVTSKKKRGDKRKREQENEYERVAVDFEDYII